MSLRFTVGTWVLPAVALLNPARAAALSEAIMLPAMEEGSLLALRKLQDAAPVGATSILKGSIQQATETVRGNPVSFRGEVFTLQPYATWVEEGLKKGKWRPIKPLKYWAKRVLGDENAAYAVQHKLYREGKKPTWFWRDTVKEVEPRIDQILRDAWERWATRLIGD